MRIVTNSRLAKRNRSLATNLFLATFVLLIGGFIAINVGVFTGDAARPDPLLLAAQTLLLPIALGLTLFSIRMTNLWARRPYPDEALNASLKGLSKKSVLYHYYHIPARHVLICPQGVFAITTRWHNGTYSVEGRTWRSKARALSRVLAALRMDGVGQPTEDAERSAAHVQKLLQTAGTSVTVKPLIVFLDPNAKVEAINPVVPVVFVDPKHDDSLTDYLRSLSRGAETKKGGAAAPMPLTDAQIASFEALTVDKTQGAVVETA